MLACVFGASPFLSNCLIRDPGFLRRLWLEGPDRCMQEIYAGVEALPADADKETAGRILREARPADGGRRRARGHRRALGTRGGHRRIVPSRRPRPASGRRFRVLLTRLADRGAFSPADPKNPEEGSGFDCPRVLASSAAGSSITPRTSTSCLLYDSDRVPAQKPYEMQSHFLRLAPASFIALLSEPTVQGMAFRVDLRPPPGPALDAARDLDEFRRALLPRARTNLGARSVDQSASDCRRPARGREVSQADLVVRLEARPGLRGDARPARHQEAHRRATRQRSHLALGGITSSSGAAASARSSSSFRFTS